MNVYLTVHTYPGSGHDFRTWTGCTCDIHTCSYVLVLNVYALICAWSGSIRDNTWLDRLNTWSHVTGLTAYVTCGWTERVPTYVPGLIVCYMWLDWTGTDTRAWIDCMLHVVGLNGYRLTCLDRMGKRSHAPELNGSTRGIRYGIITWSHCGVKSYHSTCIAFMKLVLLVTVSCWCQVKFCTYNDLSYRTLCDVDDLRRMDKSKSTDWCLACSDGRPP